jgi:hypothetical protein
MADQGAIVDQPVTTVLYLGERKDRHASIDDKYGRKYTRNFLVRTVSHLDAGAVALGCLSIPQIASAYQVTANEKDTAATLYNLEARPDGDNDPNLWSITAEYTTTPNHPDYQSPFPLLRRRRKRTRYERYQEAMEYDLTGAAVINSAGDPYEAIDHPRSYRVVEFQKNLAIDPDNLGEDYLDAVNTDPAFGYPVAACRVEEIRCDDEQYEAGVRFWPTSLTLHVKKITAAEPNPWRLKLLDQGFRTWDDVNGVFVDITEAMGRPGARPSLLNGAGDELPHGAGAQYRTFTRYPEISYAQLVNLFNN